MLVDDLDSRLITVCKTYLAKNDPGHQWGHITNVAEVGTQLAKAYGLDVVPFLLAAVCHDIFSSFNRKEHHRLSGQWVRDNLKDYGYGEYTDVVARMCEQHRASYKGSYSGIYEKCFAAADRGIPTIHQSVRRSYDYARHSVGKDHPNAVLHALGHIKEKYATGGSVRYPDVSRELFSKEIEELRVGADQLTEMIVEAIISGG